jgi:hypothetical protein
LLLALSASAVGAALVLLGLRLATWPQLDDLHGTRLELATAPALAACLALAGMALAGYASSAPRRHFNRLFYGNLVVGIIASGVTLVVLMNYHHFGA